MANGPTRDQRLDKLVQLTQSWSSQTQKAYQARVDQLNRMLKGRGVGAIGESSVSAASQILADEIDNFLIG